MSQDGIRVLLVDSNTQDRDQCKSALADLVKDKGVQLAEAASGKAGLEACRAGGLACAIISDALGDMDVSAFMDQLGGDSGRLPLPVVVIVSQRSRKAITQATSCGATDWLFKDQVASVLARVVGYAAERQVTDKRLAEQRVLFRTFLTGVPGLLVLKNKNLQYEAANPAFCQFAGKSPEDIASCSDADVFSKKDAKVFRDEDLKAMKAGVMRTTTHEIEMPSGTRCIEVTRSPLVDDEGEATGLLWCARTASGQAEDAEQDTETLEALGTDLLELICRFNAGREISYANQPFCRFAGKKREELQGQPFIPLLGPEGKDAIEAALSKLTAKEPVASLEFSPPGGGRVIRWTVRAFFRDDKLEQYQAVGSDVSELRKLSAEAADREQRVREMEQQAAGGQARVSELENALREAESRLKSQLEEAARRAEEVGKRAEEAETRVAGAEARAAEIEARTLALENALSSLAQVAGAMTSAATLNANITGLMSTALGLLTTPNAAPPNLDQSKLQELHAVLQKVNGFIEQMRARIS